MNRLLTLTAFAAVSILTFSGGALAELTAEELELCAVLELAHETTCAEFEATKPYRLQYAAGSLSGDNVTTGSIGGTTEQPVPVTHPIQR